MKKIYYLQKELVKIGDIIEHNGFRATVTEELVKFNPELFLVKDTLQELLDKAKRDYPVGTVFNSKYGAQKVLGDNPFVGGMGIKGIIQVNTDKFPGGGTIYNPENGWAEILPLKFTTEDGVDIYGDMKTYAVAKGDLDIGTPEIYGGNLKCLKYFYHKKNALAYIEKHKEKTLRNYEKMLFKSESSVIFSGKGSYFSVYAWMRNNEPKLYYTKILQLIADDLNDGRYIHERGQVSFNINKEGRVNLYMGADEGCVYFKSNELAEKARAILGDNVKFLFS